MSKISGSEKETIIEKWSRIYKKRVGELFSLEELKQEAWLALLEAEKAGTYKEDGPASEETYLTACVKHRLNKFIFNELKHQQSIPINEEKDAVELIYGSPEELVLAQCLLNSLKEKIDTSKIFNYQMDTAGKRSAKEIVDLLLSEKSYQEMSDALQKNGIKMGVKNIHKVVQKLREELAKILKNN